MLGIEIWRFDTECWDCGTTISVVYPKGLGGFGGGTWERVGDQLAQQSYCNVAETYSKSQGQMVYGNICVDCGAYQGNHFIYERVHSTVAAYQDWERAREEYEIVDVVNIPYSCRECDRELSVQRNPKLCEKCRQEEGVERIPGVVESLDFCTVCDAILHPEHRAEHHTSYDPEETIQVCDSCHAKIHNKDGFRDDLQPDLSRRTAVKRGLL